MSASEKFGVRVANPNQVISIEGRSFGEVVTFLGLNVETLKRAIAVLDQENPGGVSAPLAEVQNALMTTARTMTLMLHEHLRWAREQGLRFEIIEGRGQVRH